MQGKGSGRLTRAKTMSRAQKSARPATTTAAGTPRNARQIQEDLTKRAERIVQKISELDRELLRLGREKRAAKKGSRTEAFYKQRAIQVLSQKRSLERRLQHTMNMSHNLGTVADNAEALNIAAEIAPAAREATGQLRRTVTAGSSATSLTTDDLELLRDEYEDALLDVQEVGDILGQDLAMDEIDEDELEAELDAELAAEGIPVAPVNRDDETIADILKTFNEIPGPHDAVPSAYVPPEPEQSREKKGLFGRRLQKKGA